LASSRKYKSELDLSVEAAELNRDLLSSLAHELGGIASALDLRAAAMSRTIPDEETSALRDIAEEVRVATRAARLARGSDGFGMLNPMRRQSLDDWWKVACRFTGTVLPRGVHVEPHFSQAQLTAEEASAMTWIWLAACKDIVERGLTTPARIVLRGSAGSGDVGAGVSLLAEIDRQSVASPDGTKTRWERYAARIAKDAGVKAPSWELDNETVRWRFTIPG
jgi:hypothetical protein